MVIPIRRVEYAVQLDTERTARSDRGGGVLAAGDRAWTPEHLLLAPLGRCALTSLRYHAGRSGIGVVSDGRVEGTITRRTADGRYAFVDVAVELGVALDPVPDETGVRELLAKAE